MKQNIKEYIENGGHIDDYLMNEKMQKTGELKGQDLSGVELDTMGNQLHNDFDISYANLEGANLSKHWPDLRDTNFTESNLQNAIMKDNSFMYSNFEGADLRGADLRGADMRCTNLKGADLRGANLKGTKLFGAYMMCETYKGQLDDADLTSVHEDFYAYSDLTK